MDVHMRAAPPGLREMRVTNATVKLMDAEQLPFRVLPLMQCSVAMPSGSSPMSNGQSRSFSAFFVPVATLGSACQMEEMNAGCGIRNSCLRITKRITSRPSGFRAS